jgi:GDPmannose 4,6-dehydratase
VVRVDPQYYRLTEVDLLIGDPSKSKKLGWEPHYDLVGLVKEIVASDLEILKRGNQESYRGLYFTNLCSLL